ncbi:MAG: decarboxylating NADP(+)-dependent phosphogluconate dehydrogenase [Sphaerochaetaceae bacterium]|jgi:6-phosphogluconate dehydrogenase|nr:decarboxylating NADP(+)-dependent phosphogluconate dehydrogenase [Sphaerochaetaceae bacterium]HHU88031.1 decarboxylating NADP(+)-dependent phosphogluconate dehydrogenase [Spirochaetales bacterium]
MNPKCDIALIGLAVMGQNLVLNMSDHGYRVAVYNRTVSKVDQFLNSSAKGKNNICGTYSIEELVNSLTSPRKIVLMVKAGEVVDNFINLLLPHLDEGDLIIDGGNSLFSDTTRRVEELASQGILFIGTGVSGGEEGARNGPSIMPGGNSEAWPLVKEIFQAISAKVDDGTPCCDWVGDGGSGHYVKMVHNGIEYGDLQMISEAYDLLYSGLKLNHDEMYTIFDEWNRGELDSYLIEITRDIMGYKEEDGKPLLTKILDRAGQKGSGKWTGINSLELGVPVTLISEAVYARSLSSLKEERLEASKILAGVERVVDGNREEIIEDLRQALYASKIVSYAQGYMLLREAAQEYNWHLNYGSIAQMWREGCIIRSVFLEKIKEAYEANSGLKNLLLDDFFASALKESQGGWRRTVGRAVAAGIPMPAISAALAFYDGYRSATLPANLIQAQRDYFGAHTYERTDRPAGQFFHTNWTGEGGDVASTTYEV